MIVLFSFSYFDDDTNKQERMVTLRQILRDPQLLTLRLTFVNVDVSKTLCQVIGVTFV